MARLVKAKSESRVGKNCSRMDLPLAYVIHFLFLQPCTGECVKCVAAHSVHVFSSVDAVSWNFPEWPSEFVSIRLGLRMTFVLFADEWCQLAICG